MLLPLDAAAEVDDLTRRAGMPGIRYRTYALATNDQRAMAAIAVHIASSLGGVIIDALDGTLDDGSLVGVDPRALVSWVDSHLIGAPPRCLLHVDAVLSPWRAQGWHRVWWEQAAMIERACPLFIPTARPEIQDVARWTRIGAFWVHDAEVDVLGPRDARHVSELLRETA